jgi:PAS domain S-box-containing protein
MSSKSPVEVEVISTATGAPVALRIYPGPHGLDVYFRDLTERRRLQNELETRGELLDLAELSAGIGIWVQDLTTATMTATPQFFHLLGIKPISEPIPQDFARAFRHPEDRERVTLGFREAMARGDDTYDSEYRIVRPSGEVRWIFGRGRVTKTADGTPWRYSGIDIDITERKKQEEHLRLVMNELQHRTNNLLAIIQGLAQQSARNSQSLNDFLPKFSSRLQGIAGSNVLLSQAQWRGANLRDLLARQVAPFADLERFDLDGPPAMLSSKAVQTLGMAFHELCTNAMKYGSLSVPAGRVRVSWHLEPEALEVKWEETGGPAVDSPTRKGFGRVVAEQVVGTSLGGQVKTDFLPAGIVWTMQLPQAEFSIEASDSSIQ